MFLYFWLTLMVVVNTDYPNLEGTHWVTLEFRAHGFTLHSCLWKYTNVFYFAIFLAVKARLLETPNGLSEVNAV